MSEPKPKLLRLDTTEARIDWYARKHGITRDEARKELASCNLRGAFTTRGTVELFEGKETSA